MPLRYIEAIARTGSIRKAAENLSITSTSLNRRLISMEQELGVQLFERLTRGVRLSAAGEIMSRHARSQLSDMERVKSEIADLEGQRRGQIMIASSQAFLPYFLPKQISLYREKHPGVTFKVIRRDRTAAEQALLDHDADIAMILEPTSLGVMHTVAHSRQPIHVVMSDSHPLAGRDVVRLRDCVTFPVALPTPSHAVRDIIDLALIRSRTKLFVAVESDSFDFLRGWQENVLGFQVPIGLPVEEHEGVHHCAVDSRDLRHVDIFVGHLHERILPVAAAQFLEQLAHSLTGGVEAP
jgi:DNA-binding transcriptional LysR family regulator